MAAPRKRLRKAGRAIAIALLAVLGAVVLAIVVTLGWLHTGMGASQLAGYFMQKTRDSIQGELRVRAIEVGGLLHVCLDDVSLRDPEGHQAARAQRVCATLQPLALRAHRIAVSEVQLEKPWVEIAKVPGTSETTLARAVAPRVKSAPGGPLQWVIDVQHLALRGGTITVRPELGKPANFALEDLEVSHAHGRYAADGAAAALEIAAQLTAPGKAPISLHLDATLDGAATAGKLDLKTLRLKLGESGLSASGNWDLARKAGAIELRELVVTPKEVALFAPQAPLAGTVRGEADLKSDGSTAQLDLRLEGGGGRVLAKASAALAKDPIWDLRLAVEHVDPGALSSAAPRGEVSARATLHGKGAPQFDEHGVRGELDGVIQVGPARLDKVGRLVADLEAKLSGRYAQVKALSITALGLTLKAHGAAAYDELSLDLDVNAPNLAEAGKAVRALTGKPALPIAGAAHLTALVTGSPKKPDAQVHLRAPRFHWGPAVSATGLAVDGVLHGPLAEPEGSLRVVAQHLSAGLVDLGAPRIAVDLTFPIAHLRIDAGVKDGALKLAGDATVDDDRDGLLLSNFTVSYPGDELHLVKPANIHFRNAVIVEPLELRGEHGSLKLSAQLEPLRLEAAVALQRFELERLPQFALPKDLGLRGLLDANLAVQGARDDPDVELRADLSGAGANPVGDLKLDAHAHATVHRGRLDTDGWLASQGLLRFEWTGAAPVQALSSQPGSAPIQLEARLSQVDLARLAEVAKLQQLLKQRAHGLVEARLAASGTLAAPRATLSIDAHDLGTQQIQGVDARVGALIEKGKVEVDSTLALGGAPALGFTAQAPFDLQRALRDPAWLRGAIQRPLKAEIAVTRLELARLSQSGLLPEHSAGEVSLSVRLGGTPSKPDLHVSAVGEKVSVSRLHGLNFQAELGIAEKLKLTLGAQAQDDVVARLELGAALSGAELVEAALRRNDPEAIGSLLDRVVSLSLEIPGLPIARASQLAGRDVVAEGKVVGHVALAGTLARPRLVGQIGIKDLAAREKRLGEADLYLEADAAGALLHLGIDPPGGGNFLAHAKLVADLGARSLLRSGIAPVLDGKVTGEVQATRLDISFLSGLLTNLRRTRGTLDADVKLSGGVSKPIAEGAAHLRSGLFDVVGQGVYEDVRLDATFSPKEVVIDRITGSTGPGTFAAVLVASRKPAPQAASGESIEFTGEVHLGDGESVRDRKLPSGKPLVAGPVPVRQAGEQRADVSGELDIFGDYTDNVLTLNAKIPDARVNITRLPDKRLPGLKENPDVLLVHPGEKPHPPGREPEEVDAERKAIAEATFRLHAHLDLVHLYVRAEDFEFPVESQMNLDYDAHHPGAPTADGTVHVPSGSFTALQRRFTIADAKIIETGGEIDDPELDIKALFSNSQASVTITIAGSAKDPQIDMQSTPPMDQDAIAFFLATGRVQPRATQAGGGIDLSGAASSVIGGLLFGQVRKELASVLPVDVLTIETGAQGVSEASIGKYIGDRVFIGYRQRLASALNENTEEGRIEYQISRAVSAEATVGDRNSDLSVLYTKDF
jgi:autotransporter translocation and assembly factor TamB